MYPTLIPAPQAPPRLARFSRRASRFAHLGVIQPIGATPQPVAPRPVAPAPQPSSPTAALTKRVATILQQASASAPANPATSAAANKRTAVVLEQSNPLGSPTTPGGIIAANRGQSSAQSGYCVFTSSPETGGVTSVEPCTAGPGGTPISGSLPTGYCVNPGNAANGTNPTVGPCTGAAGQVPVGTTPPVASTTTGYQVPAGTPAGYPSDITGQAAIPAGTTYNGVPVSGTALQDASGNLWVYMNGAWVNLGTGGKVTSTSSTSTTGTTATTTASSPVPSTQPTNQPYVDSDGNIWTYNTTTGQWQITGNVSSALSESEASQYAAAAGAPSVPSGGGAGGGSSSGGYEAILSWLDSDSLLGSGIKNFWIVGAAVVGVYVLKNRERR